MRLRRKIHSAQQILKPRLNPQQIKSWVAIEPHHPNIMQVISPLQPGQGLLALSKAGVNHGK